MSSSPDPRTTGLSSASPAGGPAESLRHQKPPLEVLRRNRRSGDGWVDTPDGRYWGRYGAAGLLIHDPQRGVLLQHRVPWSAQGGTWGVPGGAIDANETPLEGAIRECHEEAGVPDPDGGGIEILDTHVLQKTGWSYTTVIARATRHLEEYVADIESVALEWVPLEKVADYPLHPGFGAAWPQLRAVLEG
ncbi:NUDIX hydrolase [Brevibacterium daeguense]|uniref:NUDIX hydrolase n=1 Tax=Brevibacterium daeguense TaxID=909936 RepID=A0ABP8EG79_9MICO|nr:NUDIX hydrolase [Brevibacterium daeguense]